MMFRIFLAAVALLALLAACGESGQETRSPAPASDTPTAPPAAETPTAEPSEETPVATEPPGGAGGGGEYTPVPITTPFPSPPPVPADWPDYSQPASEITPAFTFSYPPTWFVEEAPVGPLATGLTIYLQSWDPNVPRDNPGYPPNSIKVDVMAAPAAGLSGCGGALDRAPGTTGSGRAQDFVPAPNAAPAALGEVPAWQIVNVFDPSTSGGLTRIHAISVVYKGICFVVSAQFAQENPDEERFLQVASSFRFIE